jgi:hypothetical protein
VDPTAFATLDHRSPFLKVHLRDGSLLVLSNWEVDPEERACRGSGTRFDLERRAAPSGPLSVPLDSVAVFETNVVGIAPAVAALTVLSGASLALTVYCIANPKSCFGSCPTFYVSDGMKPVLQAEGFSSSIAPCLERTDIDALYRARVGPGRPDPPELIVRMTNEAMETHVIRHVNVLAAPRPPGGRVFATGDGGFLEGTDLCAPDRAAGEEGECTRSLQAMDGLERSSPADSSDLAAREVIDLAFARPPEGSLGLVLATRQSLLTTYLYYQGLAYLGSRAGEWLAALERGDERIRRLSEGVGSSLGGIEVLCRDAGGEWVPVGTDRETGPLAVDVRVVPLPPMPPGPATIRLRLTRGAWRIDWVALVRLGNRVEPCRLAPIRAVRGGAEDTEALAALLDPGRFLVTSPGDAVELAYSLPRGAERYELFLESRGYYLEWMREEWLAEEDAARAGRMLLDPAGTLRELAPAFKRQEAGMEAAFWGSRYAKP